MVTRAVSPFLIAPRPLSFDKFKVEQSGGQVLACKFSKDSILAAR